MDNSILFKTLCGQIHALRSARLPANHHGHCGRDAFRRSRLGRTGGRSNHIQSHGGARPRERRPDLPARRDSGHLRRPTREKRVPDPFPFRSARRRSTTAKPPPPLPARRAPDSAPGSATTDFSYLSGEYWAARKPQQGACATGSTATPGCAPAGNSGLHDRTVEAPSGALRAPNLCGHALACPWSFYIFGATPFVAPT
jgi:hypothetical protein